MGYAPKKQQKIGHMYSDPTGTKVGGIVGGAGALGLGISAATGFMDFGLSAAIGAGVGLFAPLIGSLFDVGPEAVYADAEENPIAQLPSPNSFQSSRGTRVVGSEPLASQYGVQSPMGF